MQIITIYLLSTDQLIAVEPYPQRFVRLTRLRFSVIGCDFIINGFSVVKSGIRWVFRVIGDPQFSRSLHGILALTITSWTRVIETSSPNFNQMINRVYLNNSLAIRCPTIERSENHASNTLDFAGLHPNITTFICKP